MGEKRRNPRWRPRWPPFLLTPIGVKKETGYLANEDIAKNISMDMADMNHAFLNSER